MPPTRNGGFPAKMEPANPSPMWEPWEPELNMQELRPLWSSGPRKLHHQSVQSQLSLLKSSAYEQLYNLYNGKAPVNACFQPASGAGNHAISFVSICFC